MKVETIVQRKGRQRGIGRGGGGGVVEALDPRAMFIIPININLLNVLNSFHLKTSCLDDHRYIIALTWEQGSTIGKFTPPPPP